MRYNCYTLHQLSNLLKIYALRMKVLQLSFFIPAFNAEEVRHPVLDIHLAH